MSVWNRKWEEDQVQSSTMMGNNPVIVFFISLQKKSVVENTVISLPHHNFWILITWMT